MTDIKVPTLPESVADATVAKWYKKVGDPIKRDENLVDLETDKVMLEVPAPEDGIIEALLVEEGATVKANEVLAKIKPGAAETPAAKPETKAATKPATAAVTTAPEPPAAPAPKAPSPPPPAPSQLSPAVRRLVSEHGLDVSGLQGTGKHGRLTKDDVMAAVEKAPTPTTQPSAAPAPSPTLERGEERVAMSRLRARIAERLVEVQHTAAILTTFNEVNMKPVMDLRARYKDQFEKQHNVRLGFMSFFVKAAVEALKRFPAVNASIDGTDVVYHNFFDVGIAVSSPRGLVVPIVRNADQLSMADIEAQIVDYAGKAKAGKLAIEEMTGGTFTITNGGIFGSMLSTPIINPPQSAILGMHNIVKRPVVENDEIVVRPVMYLALSYDHRIIDGRESVTFLKTIKELLEDPARLLLGV